ncbi:MAG: sodium:proton antiporter NhaD [Saprospiraceae bacterium]|nr:sodium:proton antiporter NhaD [Saprospiraceae bacterium]
MIASIILVFIVGYLAIVFEHPLKLDKTVPALIMGAVMWALAAIGFHSGILDIVDTHGHVFSLTGVTDLALMEQSEEGFSGALLHHLGKTSEILIFLIGAMTIVELIDLHRGFEVLKDWVKTKNKRRLLWIVGVLGFILSAIIDNLTATIVLVSLLRKLVTDRNERIWFVSLIVIAANAGGAWSPIGDVTTTMLWIGKKVSALGLIEYIVLPSVVCFVVPFIIGSYNKAFKGDIDQTLEVDEKSAKLLSSRTMLYLGLGMIVFVPIFKSITHLPPYLGMMLSLGVVWLVSEYIHPEEDFTNELKHKYSPHKALSRIELSSILFFLGILMAVAAFETIVVGGVGSLQHAAQLLEKAIPSQNIVVMLLGIGSAIIDNVPLVAAAMGMYTMPIDDPIWHFLAFAAGTGGSMLIIGSAAGVAAMGMERIDFIWYFRNITFLAALGYFAGCLVFILMHLF